MKAKILMSRMYIYWVTHYFVEGGQNDISHEIWSQIRDFKNDFWKAGSIIIVFLHRDW